MSGERVRVEVFTFKEGALSAVAHDLRLEAEARLERTGGEVRATLRVDDLRPVCARKGGRDAPGVLSRRDLEKIQRNLRDEVLHAKRYPEVRFTAPLPGDDAGELVGQLELHGVKREVRWRLDAGVARLRLSQPDFGVKPYTAMMGTLRVKPEVEVEVRFAGRPGR